MSTVRVYDLPTRVFHWSFAGLFATAYAIANLVDDDSARFAWHMLAGLLMGVAVLLRVAWGMVGTRYDLALRAPRLVHPLAMSLVELAVVWGWHLPAMRALADAMTGTSPSFTVIEDCGHFSAVEHPDQVASALLDLVRRVHLRD